MSSTVLFQTDPKSVRLLLAFYRLILLFNLFLLLFNLFLLLFMSFIILFGTIYESYCTFWYYLNSTILFQLIFIFIYNIFIKKFSISTN